jgi:hypothetical protein
MRFGQLASLVIVVVSFVGARAASGQTQAPPAPVPLGIDGQLSPWLEVRGEFRMRVEAFTGGGFGGDDDAYWMDRFRLNAVVRPAKSLAFAVQAHDARAFRKATGSQAAAYRDVLDLRLAYADIGRGSIVRIGRQELAFGEQRLLGHLAWANTGRSFDGVRATIKGRFGQVDGFAASVVAIDPQRFDRSGRGNVIAGTYVSLPALLPAQVVEPYVFWRRAPGLAAESGAIADLHQGTTGVRLAGRLPWTLDYATEVAVQTGSLGSDEILAWAGHGAAAKTFAALPGRPRLFGEYNHASGDADDADGSRGTFDQLYPTGHDKLGLSDQIGWRNIHHARAGIEVRASAKWLVAASYHSWWLATSADGLYNASGALVARASPGAEGRHVGQELDGQFAYSYSPQLQIGAGYAQLLPGEVLKRTTPGRSYRFSYLMATYVFLGEQPAIGRRSPR